MTRETIKCPYCHHIISYMRIKSYTDYSNIIGPELETCPNCHKQYLTGKKSISNISILEISRFKNKNILLQSSSLIFIIDIILFPILCTIIIKLYDIFNIEKYIELKYMLIPIIAMLLITNYVIFILVKKHQNKEAKYYLKEKLKEKD